MFTHMTFSLLRVTLVLPFAFGCAHAVYDTDTSDFGSSGDSVTDTTGAASAPGSSDAGGGSTAVTTGLSNPAPTGSAGTESGGAAAGGSAAGSGSAGMSAGGGGATSGTGGSASGGTGSAAGAASGGSASAGGASAGSSSGGAASGGHPGTGGGGAAAGGASAAGATSGGATSGGQCDGVPTWQLTPYQSGAQVQDGGKLYTCKMGAASGWCGLAAAYEPGVGFGWTDAWDLVGPCGS